MGTEESNDKALKDRLASAWLSGQVAEAAGIIVEEVTPRFVKSLVSRYYPDLSWEDCEDCIECGVEKLMEHRKVVDQIEQPFSYIYSCAVNEAMDILKERGRLVFYDPEWLGQGREETEDSDIVGLYQENHFDNAKYITEIALDVEINETSSDEDIKTIINGAISRLAKKRKKIVEVLLEHGAFIKNELLAELSNMNLTAVRSLKSRAFEDLRDCIPAVAAELGIDITDIIASEPIVFDETKKEIPSDDDKVK